jgi:hypothetical protein
MIGLTILPGGSNAEIDPLVFSACTHAVLESVQNESCVYQRRSYIEGRP